MVFPAEMAVMLFSTEGPAAMSSEWPWSKPQKNGLAVDRDALTLLARSQLPMRTSKTNSAADSHGYRCATPLASRL